MSNPASLNAAAQTGAYASCRRSSWRGWTPSRSEEHTSELQSLRHLVCRLLLEKKKISKARKRLNRHNQHADARDQQHNRTPTSRRNRNEHTTRSEPERGDKEPAPQTRHTIQNT